MDVIEKSGVAAHAGAFHVRQSEKSGVAAHADFKLHKMFHTYENLGYGTFFNFHLNTTAV